MERSSFVRLASNHGVEKIVPFSQRGWRRQHYTVDPGRLCAGLTYFWLDELLRRGRPLQQLRTPCQSTLERIKQLQLYSYYPSFGAGYTPTAEDRALLERKYGTSSWAVVSQRIRERGAGDCVLYDLAQRFDYEAATVTTFETFPDVLPACSELVPGSVMLAVLRYRQSGIATGHRVAYQRSREGRHYFFDPNSGAILESRTSVFRCWLDAYYDLECPIFTLPGDGPALKLYQLHGARSASPRAATGATWDRL